MIVKRHATTLLATFIPANMVWVFLACAVQCVAAAGPSCGVDEPDACCQSLVANACPGFAMSDDKAYSCLIVPREPALKIDRKASPDEPRAVVSGVAVCGGGLASGARAAVSDCGPDPPPKQRPLDRLPILRV